MRPESPADAEVEAWLKTLGVDTLCQWDTLVFLYRHQTSLVGADHIARLSGYATDRVVAALNALESLGLVERSRVSQGARLHRFTAPPAPPRGEAFERLAALTQDRAGRLLLSKHLKRDDRTPEEGLLAAPRLHEEARRRARATTQRIRERTEGRGTWRKAI
jgi:MarR family